MHYKKAYLHLYNRLTDIIETLEKIDYDSEQVGTLLLLKAAQVEAEQICANR